jgi:very-short-patch-repair endonuclease
MIQYNKKLKYTARTLRKTMTGSEVLLWSRIRRKQLKGKQFYRQKVIGNYIVDFSCPSAMLIVEVDGIQHYEAEGLRKDKNRDKYLNGLGFRVMRFFSSEVMTNIDGVVEDIYQQLPDESPLSHLEKGGDRIMKSMLGCYE